MPEQLTQIKTNKHLVCICDDCDLELLHRMIPSASISVVSFKETGSILYSKPDAVVVMVKEFPSAILNQIRNLRHFLEPHFIPVMVFGERFSFEDKRILLTNGADDCIDARTVGNGFDQWIDFLKMSKKAAKEEPVEQAPEFRAPLSKRAFDIAASLFAIVLLSPIMLIVAIAIKLESKGPIIYSSKRAGSGYKIFDFLKFRTMYVGADAELAKMKTMNQYGTENSVFFKLQNDPRVTKLGNFLRNTSLDELPQFFNVLMGDMSIVGNRPLPLYEAQQLTKDHAAMRFLAPAGITGLWQVTKRGKKDLSEEERIALDIEYANNHSLKNDINIVMKTLPALAQEVSV